MQTPPHLLPLAAFKKCKHLHVYYPLQHSKNANTSTSTTPCSILKMQTPPCVLHLAAFKKYKHLHVYYPMRHSKNANTSTSTTSCSIQKTQTPPHLLPHYLQVLYHDCDAPQVTFKCCIITVKVLKSPSSAVS